MLGLAGQLGLVGSAIELKDVFGDWQALAEMSTSGLVLDQVLYRVRLCRVQLASCGGYSPTDYRLVTCIACSWELRRRVAHEAPVDEGRARPELLVAGLLLFSALIFSA